MMEKLTEENGVELEADMHDDLKTIMTDDIRNHHSEGSFRRICWDQQLEALQTKDPHQIRWHPTLIKWCLHLKFKSTGA